MTWVRQKGEWLMPVLGIFLLAFAVPALAYPITLSPAQMEAAIAYGNQMRADGRVGSKGIMVQGTEWARDLPDKEGYVLWETPFYRVARTQAIQEKIPQETITWLKQWGDKGTWVTVVVRSEERREARTLRVLVKAGDRVLRPSTVETKELGLVSETQRYTYDVFAWFRYEDGLTSSGAVSVVVGWPDKSRMVEFDLDTLR